MSYSRERTGTRSDAPIVNPYEQFTQPEFDDFIGGLTSKIRDALDPRAGLRNRDRTADTEVDGSFREFSFGQRRSSSVGESLRGASVQSVPRSSEEAQGEESDEGEEDEDELDDERETTPVKTPAPKVVVSGAGDEDSPFVISDDEEDGRVPAPAPTQVANPTPVLTLDEEDESETDSVLVDGWNGAAEDEVQDVEEDDEPYIDEGQDDEENPDALFEESGSSPWTQDATEQHDGEEEEGEDSAQFDEYFTADTDYLMSINGGYTEQDVVHQPPIGIVWPFQTESYTPQVNPISSYIAPSTGFVQGAAQTNERDSRRVTWDLPENYMPMDLTAYAMAGSYEIVDSIGNNPDAATPLDVQEPDAEQAIGMPSSGIDDLISSITPPLSPSGLTTTAADPSLVSDTSSIATSIPIFSEAPLQAFDPTLIHTLDSPPNELGDADLTLPLEVAHDLNRDIVDFPDPHRVPEPTTLGTPEGVTGISGEAADPSLWAEPPTSNASEHDAGSSKEEGAVTPKSQSPDLPPAYMLELPQALSQEPGGSQSGDYFPSVQPNFVPLETPQEELDMLSRSLFARQDSDLASTLDGLTQEGTQTTRNPTSTTTIQLDPTMTEPSLTQDAHDLTEQSSIAYSDTLLGNSQLYPVLEEEEAPILTQVTIDADPVESDLRAGEATLRSDDENSPLPSDKEESVKPRTQRRPAKGKRQALMSSRELKALERDSLTLDMPRVRRTRSAQPSPAISSTLPTAKGRRAPIRNTSSPITPTVAPNRTKHGLRSQHATSSTSKASSPAVSRSASKADDGYGSFDRESDDESHDGHSLSTASRRRSKGKRKRVARASLTGDDEDFLPEEAERSIKKRKVSAQERDLDHSLDTVDLGSVLEHAEAEAAAEKPSASKKKRTVELRGESLSVVSDSGSESEGSDFDPEARRDPDESSSGEEAAVDNAQSSAHAGDPEGQGASQPPSGSSPRRKHQARGRKIPDALRVYKPEEAESADEYAPKTEIAYLLDVRGIAEGAEERLAELRRQKMEQKAKLLHDDTAVQGPEATHPPTKPRKRQSKQTKKPKAADLAEANKDKPTEEVEKLSVSSPLDGSVPATMAESRPANVGSSMDVDAAPPASKAQVNNSLWNSLKTFWGAPSTPSAQASAHAPKQDDSMDVD